MVKLIRYSDTDLLEFKSLIQKKLAKARSELKYLYDQIVGTGPSNSRGNRDYFDSTSRHIEMEMLNKMASRQRMFIRNLENALLRIRNKSYGICNITGQLIRKERLLLVPHATKSVAGKHNNPERKNNTTANTTYSTSPTSISEKKAETANHNTDQITSTKEEEDSGIEFLDLPRDLAELDLNDYLDLD